MRVSMHRIESRQSAWISVLLFLVSLLPASSFATDFELRDGDRVVFLGDALLEQEQYFGWIEVSLTTAFPERNVTFRNLGWNADTPAGDSRFGLSLLQAGREPADEGWKQLCKQIELTKPTVLVLGYGMASSLEGGQDGVAEFKEQLLQLIQFTKTASPDVRFLFLSPISHQGATAQRVETLAEYSKAIESIAAENVSSFVDLTSIAAEAEMRKDPIHLNNAGYKDAAKHIVETLKLKDSGWESSRHTEVLRQVILRKNEWWFHRSRPANMAYVFGFRKREQGQNAVEIPQFDKLVENEEQLIARIRSLKAVPLPASRPQLESKYAEFKEQPTPEFSIDDQWEITLWAENPLLNKPIHMNFDPQGRLWIASSEAYPMIEVGQSAPDRVIVLEDSNNDGKADESTVFADGLLIPTGIAPGDGGVYVAQSTDLLFLEDSDGDLKADKKTRVLSGFGTEDTHHNLHTLRWGPDGRLYMNQSVYTRTDTETPHGVVRLKAGGGFRVDTETLQSEIYFRGLWNSWGHQFDRFGQSFLTDGAGFAGVAYSFPGASFSPSPGARHILDLISPGRWPKFASMEIVEGDSFPADWQGSIITCDFRANRVTRFSLTEQDAGYVTKQEADLVRTSAATFRPIDVKQGPDGALYIADWSNPIINHGEVDFRDPRRDRWHGRIWRLQWKGAKAKSKEDLTTKSNKQLLELLTSTDRYDRDQARRVLLERGSETYEGVDRWLAALSEPYAKLQALWLLQGQNRVSVELLREVLADSDPKLRAAALRCLGAVADEWLAQGPQVDHETAIRLLKQSVNDSHPGARLEAIRAAARLGSRESVDLVFDALKHPLDKFLIHALQLSVEELGAEIEEMLSEGAWQSESDGESLEFLMATLPPERSASFLKKRLATTSLNRDGAGPWIELVGKAGGKEELAAILSQAANGEFSEQATKRVIAALISAQKIRRIQPENGRPDVAKLLNSDSATLLVPAMELAGLWKMRGQVKRLEVLVADGRADAVRVTALRTLGELGGSEAWAVLKRATSKPNPTGIRREAIVAMAKVDRATAMNAFFDLQSETIPEAESLGLWRGMLNVRGLGKQIASKIESQQLTELALDMGVRASNDGGRNEPELKKALAARVKTKAMTFTAEFMREVAQAVPNGDPRNGELVYRRQDLQCSNCHAIGGIGGKVGPDMTSLGASAPIDYLVESIFDPNAKIKENYHAVTVVTEDNQIFNGIEVEENDEKLVVRDANDKLMEIPQADILGKKAAKSLMPLGVVDKLTRKEQVDLITFLSQLGKPGEFDASQGGVARMFEVFAGTHRREQQGAEKIISGEITEGWARLPTRVNGDMPKEFLEKATEQPFNISLVNVYARTKIEVTSAGEAKLSVPNAAKMWLDGKPVAGEMQGDNTVFIVNASVGQHLVLIRMDARDLPEVFRLTSQDLAFVGL
ncbi:MAG: PVC-type heme-binding CxxCH protein [Planctomycetota bacterium]